MTPWMRNNASGGLIFEREREEWGFCQGKGRRAPVEACVAGQLGAEEDQPGDEEVRIQSRCWESDSDSHFLCPRTLGSAFTWSECSISWPDPSDEPKSQIKAQSHSVPGKKESTHRGKEPGGLTQALDHHLFIGPSPADRPRSSLGRPERTRPGQTCSVSGS